MDPSHRRPLTYGLTTAVLAALLGAPAVAAPQPGAADAGGKQRVIVELTGDAALKSAPGAPQDARAADVKAERRKVTADQSDLLDAAADKGVEPKAVRKLGLLLNAVAMTVPSAGDVAKLRALPGVKSVRPDTRIRVQDTDAQQLTGVPEVWKRDAPDGSKATGKGTTVAVVDSGIDYTHPDLGGGFGEGHKVVAGHDFVNNDGDPMDDNRHGTHVAGIIAGKAAEGSDADKGVTGAAPDAQLTAYKAMDADGYGDTSAVIAGIEAAADPANPHRADVINLSVGGPGDGTDPLGKAAAAAVDAGVVVVAAAGNQGPGPYTVGSPAAARGVIAVGASTSGIRVPELRYAGEKLDTYRGVASANPPAGTVSGKVVSIGAGSPEEWEQAGDVRGKFVLYAFPPATSPEGLSGEDQTVYQEAEKRGAHALIGGAGGGGGPVTAEEPDTKHESVRIPADSATQGSGDDYRMDRLPVLGVDRFQGQDLAAMAGTDQQLTLSGRDSTDEIASFSSRGPDYGLGMKPDIVAPGVEIRSAVPKSIYRTGIQRLSGTSMASPLVAASAALLHQLHPDRKATDLSAALIGSAKQLKDTDRLAQGAGRLDVPAAADAALTAAPATVSFRLPHMDGRTVSGEQTVTLHNPGDKTVTGRTSVSGKGATVSPRTVAVPAHGTTQVRLRIRTERPEGSTVHFSGAVTVDPAGDKTPGLTVPYLLDSAPLYIDATPDPTHGPTDVYVYSPTALKSPPTLTIDPPHARPYTTPTKTTGDPHYYLAADLKGERAGTYRITARATTDTGMRQYGESGFEVAAPAPPGDGGEWQPIGPNSSSGELTPAPSADKQAVISQYGVAGGWLTTDGGESWKQQSHTPFMGVGVKDSSFVIDKDNPKRWWSTVAASNWTVRSGGIMRTDDNGRTWQRLNTPDADYSDLVADRDTKVLVAQADGALHVSRDAGETWAAEDVGLPGDVADIAFGGDDLYFWSGQSAWVVRGMSGASPQPAERIYTADSSSRLSGFDADDGLVAVKVQGKSGGVHISADGGRTWAHRPGNGWGLLKVADGGIHYDKLSGGAELSTDAGKTWTTVPKPSSNAVVFDYDRWNGSYTVTASPGSYRPAGDGFDRLGVQGESVPALAATGGGLLAATASGTYRTDLPARSPEWGAAEYEGTTGAAVSELAAYPKDPKIVWRTLEGIGGLLLQRSDDAGRTWQDRGRLDGRATSLLVDPDDPDQVAVGYTRPDAVGIYTTTDGGDHWKSRHHNDYIQALEADPDDPGRIWVGGLNGLYYSDDFGATLHKRSDTEVTTIGFAGDRMIIGGNGLRYSTDRGRTLHKAETGGLRVQAADLIRADGAWYAATTHRWVPGEPPHDGRGVLRSTDGGRTWHNVSAGLQNTNVLSLATDGRSLYAGTEFGGVHRMPLAD
ncbi:S8 family serine peptidase [Streptomyces sp. A7024]|uniref:S8 family serine peptidase n=1 Tax=Streptomyces coryli TaxID=1128680 RepID=A0A6G4TVC5_9ACTN|nr:S8 family serine peptidase [Streptomyces coryli]NGN63935.1 S8 family serine peptidase [Streptomyces coryli]